MIVLLGDKSEDFDWGDIKAADDGVQVVWSQRILFLSRPMRRILQYGRVARHGNSTILLQDS